MGYHTNFNGNLQLNRPATLQEIEYINEFSRTRRMKRDVNKLMEKYEGKFGYPFATGNTPEEIYGKDGEYCIANDDDFMNKNETIIDYNTPPGQVDYNTEMKFELRWAINEERTRKGICQPSLWCDWVITDDGMELEWDGGEKFHNYVEWLKYLINHFFEKWGVKLNGEIE